MTVHGSTATRSKNLRVLDRACVIVRHHITSTYPPGAALPSTKQLALALGLPQKHVLQGLLRLNSSGEIALHTGNRPIRLRTREPHPRDRALQGAVRDRIRAGRYQPGQALPTGLLGDEFGLRPHHVQRALRFLTAEGTLRYQERGAHGPGHYVPARLAEDVS
ncbi:GntR family transcriptional regulator (plasmid) [Streptomyces nojiriensis]|uniref:GntR family transcriptional regulator n=1 Tax=Streptomyces nojiriensis TaxID=66374 RepID=UPI002E17ED05